MEYRNFARLSLLTFMLFYLSSCGGKTTPKEDSNTTEINTTVQEEGVILVPLDEAEAIPPKEENEVNQTDLSEATASALPKEDNSTIEETPKEETETTEESVLTP